MVHYCCINLVPVLVPFRMEWIRDQRRQRYITIDSIMWFGQNIIWLWLTPVALGCAYYIIPSVLNRPIDKYYLAIFGFWCIAGLAPGQWFTIWKEALFPCGCLQ